jgi:hypothetical protein
MSEPNCGNCGCELEEDEEEYCDDCIEGDYDEEEDDFDE